MSNDTSIKGKIREFVISRIGTEIPDNENFFETGYVTSMFGVQIIVFLEETFGVEVSDDDLKLENFDSIDHLSAFASEKSKCFV